MNFYSGLIIEELKENEIFVFGSNPEGRHGAGTAKIARDKFGAKYGVGRGMTGRCWALPTKNLTAGYYEKSTGIVYEKKGYKSISREQIIENIRELYEYASKNKEKTFYVAYTYNGFNLNGYTGDEMLDMFIENEIPENIKFHESFLKNTKLLNSLGRS